MLMVRDLFPVKPDTSIDKAAWIVESPPESLPYPQMIRGRASQVKGACLSAIRAE